MKLLGMPKHRSLIMIKKLHKDVLPTGGLVWEPSTTFHTLTIFADQLSGIQKRRTLTESVTTPHDLLAGFFLIPSYVASSGN